MIQYLEYLKRIFFTTGTKYIGIILSELTLYQKVYLKYGNLKNDKYEKLFLLYVKYSYDYIKNIYNQDLSDEELLNILKDKDDIFIVKVNILEKNKNKNNN